MNIEFKMKDINWTYLYYTMYTRQEDKKQICYLVHIT